MKIGSLDLAKNIMYVAEIGNNHEGNFNLAKKMVEEAASAGANAVKFQAIRAQNLVSSENIKRYEQLKSFELTQKEFMQLANFAKKKELFFIVTPLDLETVDFLRKIVSAFKISSGDNNFYPLLEKVAKTGKPIILSTGLADLKQIKKSKNFIENVWKKSNIKQKIAILHCVTSYPVPDDQANLLAIQTLKNEFDCVVGYSDHTLGIEACVISAVLGAKIIEKHFTIDKNYSDFRDHKLSATRSEFITMVDKINKAMIFMGNGKKQIQKSERAIRSLVRRSITTAQDLKAGKKICFDDLNWIRVPGGLQSGVEGKIVGKKLKVFLKKNELILMKHLKKD